MASVGNVLPESLLPVDHISTAIGAISSNVLELSQTIHKNPELGYQETIAHDSITELLINEGFTVKRHAYGLATSFEAEFGSGGRLVVYCAEYDALPEIGHACGHNLIAASSVAAFIGLARTLKSLAVDGRVRILGTPAEEGSGGKIKLLQAGAFADDVAAAMMLHPLPSHALPMDVMGIAGAKMLANARLLVEFNGQASHAGAAPWNGLNALDAAVATYTSVSMLRQHIRPDERINVIIKDGGTAVNIIPAKSSMEFGVRAPTWNRAHALVQRVKNCLEAAATATGCTVTHTE
jgi:amidohydrolase